MGKRLTCASVENGRKTIMMMMIYIYAYVYVYIYIYGNLVLIHAEKMNEY